MAIMAPTPDQVFVGMMQRGTASSSPLPYPPDSISDVGGILGVPSAYGRGAAAGIPGVGRYWSRSSWSGCLVDNPHLGLTGQQQLSPPNTSTLGMPQAFSSPTLDQFASFGAGKYNVPGGGETEPFSVGKSLLCEPASGGASVSTVQPLLEAVEGVTKASTMVEAAAATIAAATHGHVQVTAISQENNNSSCSEHHPGGRGGGASPGAHSPARSPSHDSHPGSRKRKKELSPPHPKGGEGESGKPKRCKGDREEGSKARGAGERSSSEASTESGSPKAPRDSCKGKMQSSGRPKEYSKQDYIHVRARRGQATDSHSLAERVRREKISERMKYLQDLVPGCKKVTGKAVMLDEIINYVQSLQRQVEHLSMKLASVNRAQPDLTLESLVSNKEMLQTHLSSILGSTAEAPGALDVAQMGLNQQAGHRLVGGGPCGFDFRSLGNAGLDNVSSRHNMSPPSASLAEHMTMAQRSFDNNISQPTGWDGELQSVVQMGFSHQGRLGASAGLHGQVPVGHLKVEF